MAFGPTWEKLIEQWFPIVAVIPPTRYERFKAWVRGETAPSTVIRRLF